MSTKSQILKTPKGCISISEHLRLSKAGIIKDFLHIQDSSLDIIPNIVGCLNPISLSKVDFSKCMVDENLKKLQMTKSPGLDPIITKLFKSCEDVLSEPFSMLLISTYS